MSRPPVDRNYSYEPNDGTALNALPGQHDYSPYRDESPSRMQQAPPGYQYEAYTPSGSNAPTPPLHRQNPFSDPDHNRSSDLSYAESYRPTPPPTSGMDSSHARDSPSRALGPGYAAGHNQAGWAESHHGQESMHMDHYPAQPVFADGPYNKRYSSPWDSRVDNPFDPNDIDDDGDDGIHQAPIQRRSMLSLGRGSNNNLPTAGAGVTGAAAGAAAGLGSASGSMEKNLREQEARKRKKKRLCLIVIGVIAVLAVFAGAIVGGILGSRAGGDSGGNSQSAAEDDAKGDLDLKSKEIQDLMGNSDLKKVFPAMDYTPFNAQYPACLSNPPSQNNITRDMAVLSQLTNVVRLYGTDCNQTDMVLHALDQLEMDKMKVWLGVWLDKNQTTNDRNLGDMYTILDRHGQDRFAGVIVGNEILFREDMTTTELATVIEDVRSNFTDLGIKLELGVADLGDNWRKDGTEFIKSVDVVMSNIHPFFAGVTSSEGADWTHAFWQNNVVALTEGTTKRNVIAEVGWPSGGGKSCGEAKSCTEGSVATVKDMNIFMEDFVCEGLKNGTDYFWFEAFDEPWKEQFNEPGKEWEDKWGLMTPDRKLKPGLEIPDCDGQRIKDP